VERKKFGTYYAMKEMSKVKIVNKKSVNSVLNERRLLQSLKHPYEIIKNTDMIYSFLINMFYAFSDYENLYLVMDLVTGGDLRYHLTQQKRFSE
jgi:serine/threonine kinase 32